jgi:hypothetical protein
MRCGKTRCEIAQRLRKDTSQGVIARGTPNQNHGVERGVPRSPRESLNYFLHVSLTMLIEATLR